MLRFIVNSLLLLAVSLLDGCTKTCALVGCFSGLQLREPTELSFDDELADGASIEVCRNATCFSGTLGAPVGSPRSARVRVPEEAAEHPEKSFDIVDILLEEQPDHSVVFSMRWQPAEVRELKRDDTYSVEIRNADATIFTAHEKVGKYTANEVNGPGCGACYLATIDRTQQPTSATR